MNGENFYRLGNRVIKTLIIFGVIGVFSLIISYYGISKENILMVFLLGVLFTTILTSSYICGIIASFSNLLLFNYLYTEPRFTFVIYSGNDIILLIFFLITAIISGTVASRLQQQTSIAKNNECTTQTLYNISSGFLSISGEKNIIFHAICYIKEYTGCISSIKMDNSDKLYTNTESYNMPDLSNREYIIKSATGRIGIANIYCVQDSFNQQDDLIVQTVITHLGISLDRESLYNERENIRFAMERERLRSTFLRAVAHDLRSPLTALSGASNLLADNYDNLNNLERKKLSLDISEEITWLTSLVENILNMTRINDANLVLQKEAEVVDDVISEAISHVRRLFQGRSFTVNLPNDVVMVSIDGKLIVQVLINLLENAIRHTPPESEVVLDVTVQAPFLMITVSDTGNGIDKRIKNNLFERFVTLNDGVTDGKRGMGLGLAICKAIVEAHNGRIYVEDNHPKGAKFVFTLPLEA
jgi:two-component system sensor histidine kinase KdpD